MVRFPVPPPPKLAQLPAFTSQSPLPVSGTAVPSARVDIFVNDAVTAITGASDGAGAFTIPTPLELNAKNGLEVFATALLGDGLTSAPVQVTITHDSQPPTVNFVDSARQRFRAPERAGAGPGRWGSRQPDHGVHAERRRAGSHRHLSPPPPAPAITANANWNTTGGPEGAQTLVAKATDQAGNPPPRRAPSSWTTRPPTHRSPLGRAATSAIRSRPSR